MDARLYLITDDRLDPVPTAIDGGVDLVQLRHKTLDDDAFLELARRLAKLCHARRVPLILNDRVHLVEPAGADGAHIGEGDMAPEQARDILGPNRLLGISTHSFAELAAARAAGADHCGLGPMFSTATKQLDRPPGGAELVKECHGATNLPVFCIGGITPQNVGELVAAGATRVAVSSAILGAGDPRATAALLRARLG